MSTWIDAGKQLPDDEQCVLIALDDGEAKSSKTVLHTDQPWSFPRSVS